MSEILDLLQAFHADKLTQLLRHQAAARVVGQYDVNNTYQYIVNREDVQLTWVAGAIRDLGASPVEPAGQERVVPGRGEAAARAAIEEDARDAQAFVDRWRPRVDALTNARHRNMLRVVLGETLEQLRFFQQALAGRTDLLGRRGTSAGPARGEVLPARWIE